MDDEDLTTALARLARSMQAEPDLHSTLDVLVTTVAAWLGGRVSVGITMVHSRRHVETAAASDGLVLVGDKLQYELSEGPCLDAIWESEHVLVRNLASEQRWPRWAPRVVEELHVGSMLCTRLFTYRDTLGALNAYSRDLDAFGEDEQGLVNAVVPHAAVAAADAREIDSLAFAMDRRTVIGQAMGIVMERLGLSDVQAIAALKRLSSERNRKLYDVAQEIVSTRRIPS